MSNTKALKRLDAALGEPSAAQKELMDRRRSYEDLHEAWRTKCAEVRRLETEMEVLKSDLQSVRDSDRLSRETLLAALRAGLVNKA